MKTDTNITNNNNNNMKKTDINTINILSKSQSNYQTSKKTSIINKVLSKLHSKYGQKQLINAFKTFDNNNDYKIDQTELLMGMGILGYRLNSNEKTELTSYFMNNPSKKINYNDFILKINDNIKEKDFQRVGKIHNLPSVSNKERNLILSEFDYNYSNNIHKQQNEIENKLDTSRKLILSNFINKISNKYGIENTRKAFRNVDTDGSGIYNI